MNMEFLQANFINTTTMMTATSGTGTFSYLIDRNLSNKWQTSGENSDTATSQLSIVFPTSKNINRIILQDTNFKSFSIYYNSTTSNKFTLQNALTTTSEWSQNSETSLYLMFATTSVDSIDIVGTTTMSANSEKEITELWITENYHTLTNNPSARNYDDEIDRKEYVHEMSNGGVSTYVVANNFKADIKLEFISESDRDELEDIHDVWEPIVFTPDPTGTSWNNRIYEVNWIGGFDFRYADNYKDNGYSGSIRLRETPK